MSNSLSFKDNQIPLVSVVVTTYNHKNYIAECLDSILMQQTSFPFEIILGEDESNDGTREICKEYAKNNPYKVKLFLRSRKDVIYIDGKPTGRFNFIQNLKSASGKYIALCEGDDYWTDPLKLQKQIDFLEANPDYNICFHSVKLFNQDSELFEKDTITRKVKETTTVMDLAKGNFIHTPSVVLRNSFKLPKWFEKVTLGDWTLYMIAIGNGKVKKINEIMGVYRLHSKSIWSKKPEMTRIKNTLTSLIFVNENIQFEFFDVKSALDQRINNYRKKIDSNFKMKLKAFFKKKI